MQDCPAEDSACALCGVPGLSVLCENEDCREAVHLWCLDYWGLGPEHRCPVHTNKRKTDWKITSPKLAAAMIRDPQAVGEFRQKEGDASAGGLCTGTVFWYIFGSQYFPLLEQVPLPSVSASLDVSALWETEYDEALVAQQLAAVQVTTTRLMEELEQARTAEAAQWAEFMPAGTKLRTTEDEWILKDLKALEFKRANRDYLKYFEGKERVVLPDPPALSARSLEPPPNEEDFTCTICGDGDYEDDNLIVICAVCELGVHMKCFGIVRVPAGDWICEVCRTFGREGARRLPCAFCPNKGGGLKQTVHASDGSLDIGHYPTYDRSQPESVENPSAVWCHVFCARHISGVIMQDRERVEGIYLAAVEPRRFKLKCEVCNTRSGACVQCSHKKCSAAFHPECGKSFFLYTRDKYGRNEENAVYCNQHRTLKLRKFVELKEKHQVDEVCAFFRKWEKWITKRALKKSFARKTFTPEESALLAQRIRSFLQSICFGPRLPFTVTVCPNGQVIVEAPSTYNLMEPKTLVQKGLSIPGRTAEQCCRYYEEYLYAAMKKELEREGKPVRLYASKPKPKQSHKKATKKAKTMKHTKTQGKKQMILLPERPVITEELFCVCRRPYVQFLPRLLGEADCDYDKKIRDNSMIQCEVCVEWFHLGCVGYFGSATDAEKDEQWKCPKCR